MLQYLPCTNCQTPVPPNEAKIFARVFLCSTCHRVASRLKQRAREVVEQLLVLQDDAIRVALIEHRLVVGPEFPLTEPTKREILEQILTFEEIADANRSRTGASNTVQQPGRSEGDRPNVRHVDLQRGGPPQARPLGLPGHHQPRDPVDPRSR